MSSRKLVQFVDSLKNVLTCEKTPSSYTLTWGQHTTSQESMWIMESTDSKKILIHNLKYPHVFIYAKSRTVSTVDTHRNIQPNPLSIIKTSNAAYSHAFSEYGQTNPLPVEGDVSARSFEMVVIASQQSTAAETITPSFKSHSMSGWSIFFIVFICAIIVAIIAFVVMSLRGSPTQEVTQTTMPLLQEGPVGNVFDFFGE